MFNQIIKINFYNYLKGFGIYIINMFNKRDIHSMLCNTYVVDPVILVCHKSMIFVNAKNRS